MSITRSNILEADHCFEVIYDQLHDTFLPVASLICELNNAVREIKEPSILSKRESISVFINWIIGKLESEKNSTATSKILLSEAGKNLATGEVYKEVYRSEAEFRSNQIDLTVKKLNDIKKEANTFSVWTTLQECLSKLIILFKSFSRSKTKETFKQPKTALFDELNTCGLFRNAEGSTHQSTDQQYKAPAVAA